MPGKKSTAVAVRKETMPSLESPKTMLSFAVQLKTFIVKQKLYTNIQGKNYVNVEGWQFAGGNMGIFPVVESCDRLDRDGEVIYRTSVALYSKDRIISRGFAVCSDQEANMKKRASRGGKIDEYVIASMSQTRAEGKAYRLILGWLMKAAGYEGTPTEEVQEQQAAAKKATKSEPTVESAVIGNLVDALSERGVKGKGNIVMVVNECTDAQISSYDEITEALAKRTLAKVLMKNPGVKEAEIQVGE